MLLLRTVYLGPQQIFRSEYQNFYVQLCLFVDRCPIELDATPAGDNGPSWNQVLCPLYDPSSDFQNLDTHNTLAGQFP